MLDFRAFNDLKIAYYISTISSMFLLLIVLRLIFSSLILAIVFALFFGLIISIIFTFIGNSRIKKIIKDLENNCNALAFLNSFTAIADRLNKPNNLVYINLGTGYFYIGDFEKAYSILKLVNFKKIRRQI